MLFLSERRCWNLLYPQIFKRILVCATRVRCVQLHSHVVDEVCQQEMNDCALTKLSCAEGTWECFTRQAWKTVSGLAGARLGQLSYCQFASFFTEAGEMSEISILAHCCVRA